jgi:ATP-dependent DNA helicase RecG
VADLDEASEGEQIVVALTPIEHRAPRSGRGPYRVLAQDAKGNILALTYFGRASYSAKKTLPVGEMRWIAGRLDRYGDMLQIVHPDHVTESSAGLMGSLVEPVYSLAEGLTQPKVADFVAQSLARATELPEWIEQGLLDKH